MENVNMMDASCRIAFTALIHDIGKLAERARLPFSEEQKEVNKHLYCPFNKIHGYHSHVHAAYTGLAVSQIEPHLPPLKGNNLYPFAKWRSQDADDSMINAAAMHHKPQTFLQWIVATADRVASGFERDQFEAYNLAQDEGHYRSRLLSQFNQIQLSEADQTTETDYRYPLESLSVNALSPVESHLTIPENNKHAQEEYAGLWEQFLNGLEVIPDSHRKRFDLWLDHFDSLWQSSAHCIPSATAFGTKPDVSLYDHCKTTAALACALWRYHHENGDSDSEPMAKRTDWDKDKFLLIQGDFFGVQNFIFASGSDTNKGAAKLLRGRSFYVSLLTECAALKLLETLELPSTSMVLNAAGKFLIVAPNTTATIKKLKQVQSELNNWFLQHTYGQSGIGIAWQTSCCNDFISNDKAGSNGFSRVIRSLFTSAENNKFQRLDLCAEDAPDIFTDYLKGFDHELGVCSLDSRLAANKRDENGTPVNRFSYDQLTAGKYLANPKLTRLLISSQPIQNTLETTIFGYYINFTQDERNSGHFSNLVASGVIKRALDLSLPESDPSQELFHGYATRFINAYVPTFDPNMNADQKLWEQEKYKGIEFELSGETQIKTLEHIACEDRTLLPEKNTFTGIRALHCLKGDVDNLGAIFEKGLSQPTFAKLASLSRRMNLFFSSYLPYLCRQSYPDCYTIFAGGDDFFLIGPWHSTLKLAARLRDEFEVYTGHNPDIHFSVGLTQVKPGIPIRYMAEQSEHALELSKGQEQKNSVTVYGQTVYWRDFQYLMRISEQLDELRSQLDLSTGYLYGLIELSDMAEQATYLPEAARWRSYLSYRTSRMVTDKLARQVNESKEEHNIRCERLTRELLLLLGNCISTHKAAAKIAIFCHLYKLRD